MEEEYISSLVTKKDEFRKKLFETFEYCKYSKQLEFLEINFFQNASRLIDDQEFNKLIKKYLDVIDLISLIKRFRKINEEED